LEHRFLNIKHIKHDADYFPYGKMLREFVDSDEEKYLTTQHERNRETGLDYRGARYYDSDVATFLSLDPLAATYPEWSDYHYVLGNPVTYIDLTGMSSESTGEESTGWTANHVYLNEVFGDTYGFNSAINSAVNSPIFFNVQQTTITQEADPTTVSDQTPTGVNEVQMYSESFVGPLPENGVRAPEGSQKGV